MFTKEMLTSSGSGTKDMGKSLFSVWEDIFSAPNARYRTSANRTDFGKESESRIIYQTPSSY